MEESPINLICSKLVRVVDKHKQEISYLIKFSDHLSRVTILLNLSIFIKHDQIRSQTIFELENFHQVFLIIKFELLYLLFCDCDFEMNCLVAVVFRKVFDGGHFPSFWMCKGFQEFL